MIKRLTLCDAVVDEIRSYIKEKNLKVGDKLPNQQELCQMFGISRTSLREAIKCLQAFDEIEVLNGKGIYIKQRDTFKIEANIDNLKDKKKALIEMLEIRRSLEGLAVKLAAERATEEEINKIEGYLKLMIQKTEDDQCDPEEDKAFHEAIYHSCRNDILIEFLDKSYNIFEELWENPLGIGSAMNELELHLKMFEFIKQHKIAEAEKAFHKLIDREIEYIVVK